jgi:hypothetical protein
MTEQHHHLQLIGQPTEGDHFGPPAPLGSRVFLMAGTFAVEDEHLGPVNLSLIPIPQELLEQVFLLRGYQIWSHPEDGELQYDLPLAQPMLMERPNLPCLPPCAIGLHRDLQPLMQFPQQELNPCPGWKERIHLYQKPAKPFEATAVIYLDAQLQVAAAELFDPPLRQWRPGVPNQRQRRCWIKYLY